LDYLWNTIWRLLKKLKIELPCALAILFLGIHLKECKLGYNKGTCTPMFIASLFRIAKLWNQPRCPTTDEWIKKMCACIYSGILFCIKKNEILLFAGK
jgi:hypothetical protein